MIPYPEASNAPAASPRMIERPCPLCGAADTAPYLTVGDTTFGFPGMFQIVRCRRCTMRFTNPQLSPEELPAYYPPDYSAHASDRPAKRRTARIGRDPWDRLPETGGQRLLDVGCGSGAYLLRWKELGWSVYGVEPSVAAVETARRYGLDVIQGVIPGAALPEPPFEVITMLGVLDHVPEPLATLRVLRPKLASGGRLIISVPNTSSAAADIFKEHWPGWDLPRHQNHFTPETLTEMLRRTGFTRVDLYWKRRTSRWQRGAQLRAASSGALGWRLLARSRDLCSLLAHLRSRGRRSDEIVAVALH